MIEQILLSLLFILFTLHLYYLHDNVKKWIKKHWKKLIAVGMTGTLGGTAIIFIPHDSPPGDPAGNWFGYQGSETNSVTIEDYITGSYYECEEDAFVSNISAHLACNTAAKNATAMVYEYVDNSVLYAGKLLGTSDEVLVPVAGLTWIVFPFTEEVVLEANTLYYLMVWAEDGDGTISIRLNGNGDSKFVRSAQVYNGEPSPLTGETVLDQTANISIYLSYLEIGNTYYVNTTGDDDDDGSLLTPFATIQRGINATLPGDTVIVQPGEYNERVEIWYKNGTPNHWIKIQAETNHTAIVNGHGLGGTYDGIFWVRWSRYINITGFMCRNTTSHIIFVQNYTTHDIVIDNITGYNASSSGAYFYRNINDSVSFIENVSVLRCTFYELHTNNSGYWAQEGISLSGVNHFEIAYCYVYKCNKEGIDMKSGTRNGTCHDNRINNTHFVPVVGKPWWDGSKIGIYVDGYYKVCENISIYNNTVWGNYSGIRLAAEKTSGSINNISVYNNIVNITSDDAISFNGLSLWENTHKYDILFSSNTVVCNNNSNLACTPILTGVQDMYIHNFTVKNNIFLNNAYYQLSFNNIPSTSVNITVNNNLYRNLAKGYSHTWYQDGGNKFGDDELQADPQLADIPNNNFHLNATSPCIDAGNTTGVPDYDIEGNARPVAAGYDIGAYEFPNMNPTQSGESPTNGSTGIDLTPQLYVICSDVNGDLLNATWWSNSSGSWIQFAVRNTSFSSGTNITQTNVNFSSTNTKYYWSVNVSDGVDGWGNYTYNFTSRLPYTPQGISTGDVIPVNRTRMQCTWTRGTNTSHVYINYLQGGTGPATRAAGTFLYNGTALSVYMDNLIPGTLYTCAFWGYNDTDNLWSSKVDISDITDFNLNATFSGENPANGTTNVDKTQATVNVTIEDPEGDWFNWTIQGEGITSASANQVHNGSKQANTITPLTLSHTYTWYVNVTDEYGNDTREWYNFTTRDAYTPATISFGSLTVINRTRIKVDWTNGANTSHQYIRYNTGSAPTNRAQGTFLYNGTGTTTYADGLSPGTMYYFSFWGYNDTDNVFSVSYVPISDTTDFNLNVTYSNENPTNGSIDQNLSLVWNITIEDPEGDKFNWTITCSNGNTNSSNLDINGSKKLSISGLAYSTEYIVWVNTTDIYGNLTSEWFNFTTNTSVIYKLGIRNNGVDYFIWLGINCTASDVAGNITGFDEAAEYIKVWNSSTWDATNGCWILYYGDGSGTDFTVTTFDVIGTYLTDVGTQDISMTSDANINYSAVRTLSLIFDNTINKGYNYTGYTSTASRTLKQIATTNISMSNGELISVWDNSTYAWRFYIVGFPSGYPNYVVSRWKVVETHVNVGRTWNM